jgi:putative transcriptional regulator
VNIRWRLRMAAARREVWTGTQLRRLLAELCTALDCTPNDLFDVDTAPVERPAVLARPQAVPVKAVSARGRSLPPV